MDNNTTRLELFRKAIKTQADAEVSEIISRSEAKCAAIAQERSERSANEAISAIREEYDRTAAEYRRELSRCEYDMKKAILAHRFKLTNELFDEIRENLRSFTGSPEYTVYLKNAAARAESELGSNGTVIRIRPADAEAVKTLTNLPTETDSNIMLGGITALNAEKGLCLDLTLDSRLRDEEAAFADRTELRL